MNPYGLVSSLAWAGLVLYALVRLLPLLERLVATRAPDPTAGREEPVPLPPDILAFVNQYGSEWARTDANKAVRERYEQYRDWNAVRRAIGLGVMGDG